MLRTNILYCALAVYCFAFRDISTYIANELLFFLHTWLCLYFSLLVLAEEVVKKVIVIVRMADFEYSNSSCVP
jgi:hypothetical protein